VTRAIIFVPEGKFDPHASRCMEYCKRRGYEFQGIVSDWDAVDRMRAAGEIEVVLVSKEEHLDPNRKPRIEVVANEERRPGLERTRILRRNEGA
jgi:hypothetical protein